MKFKKPSAKFARNASAGAMAVAAALVIALTSAGGSAFESDFAENAKSIAALESDIEMLKDKEVQSAADKNKDLFSASDAGRKVAELQSKYEDLDPVANRDGVKANAEGLSGYFTDDAQAGRTPWFMVSKGDAKAVWKFESTYSTSESQTPVIWTCRPDGGDTLIAFATAVFDAKADKFHDVVVYQTTNAADYVEATGRDEAKKKLDSIISELKELPSGDEVVDGQVAQDQSDARDWLKGQADKGGDE